MLSSPLSFALAANVFVEKHRLPSSSLVDTGLIGWQWTDHPTYPALGFLSRHVRLTASTVDSYATSDDDELPEEQPEADEAAALPEALPRTLTCMQSVAFSPTFRLPVFYFTVHDTHGAPLSLSDIIRTPLLPRGRLPDTDATPFGLTPPGSPFPLLSQGDHPSLGTPSWYLHPCGMPSAMAELAEAVRSDGGFGDQTEDEKRVRWLELWFMLLATVVDLRA